MGTPPDGDGEVAPEQPDDGEGEQEEWGREWLESRDCGVVASIRGEEGTEEGRDPLGVVKEEDRRRVRPGMGGGITPWILCREGRGCWLSWEVVARRSVRALGAMSDRVRCTRCTTPLWAEWAPTLWDKERRCTP